jgi:hypothetical protein
MGNLKYPLSRLRRLLSNKTSWVLSCSALLNSEDGPLLEASGSWSMSLHTGLLYLDRRSGLFHPTMKETGKVKQVTLLKTQLALTTLITSQSS